MTFIYYKYSIFTLLILFVQRCNSYGACSSLFSTNSLTIRCEHNNKTLDHCENPPEGTQAFLTCNRFYEEATLESNPKRLCRDRRWDGPIPQCFPICGINRVEESFNRKKDQNKLLDYPWVVEIYNKNKFLCEGTLIAMNIVLTAARCVSFYDEDNGTFNPIETIFVGSGKFYLGYDDGRYRLSQYSSVLEVYVPNNNYKRYLSNLASDIAVLILRKPFQPSQFVQPICLNFDSSSYNSLLQDSGILTDWDLTTDANRTAHLSDILKVVQLLYVPYTKCNSKINRRYVNNIPIDKICKKNFNNVTIACTFKVGGGMVLKNKINDRYYMVGVLIKSSLEPLDLFTCDPIPYGLYITVYQHQSFIEIFTANIEMKNCVLPKYIEQPGILENKFGQQAPSNSKLTLICDDKYGAMQYHCLRSGKWYPDLSGCTQKVTEDITTQLDKSTNLNYPYYIIIILSIIIIIVIPIVVVILYKFKFKQEWQIRREIKLAGLDRFHNGNLKRFNPELDIGDQAEILPYNNNFEFPRDKLILGKQLGSGAFGIVMQADAFGIITNEEQTVVAVKTAKNNADHIQMKALTSELKIMVHLGKHLNIVNLLGACTQNITKRELLVIVEYCQFGNLYNYLLRNRENFIDQIDNVTEDIDYTFGTENLANALAVPNNLSTPREIDSIHSIYTKDLVSWSFQVARGMEYLASRKILHGDLAARNILLAKNNIVKICDFGLAKRLYQSLKYKKQQNCPLPIKWMAVKSIRDQIFSTQSDVWSFGIVLWEFFSLAQTPYPGMEADEKLYYKLLDGYKMESPPYAPNEMYKIMCDCWSINPASRPCFNELAGRVGLMLEENVRQHYIDLNDPYFVMNTQRLNENQPDYLGMLSPHNRRHTVAIQGDHAVGASGYLSLTSSDPAINRTVNSLNNKDVKSVLNEPKIVDAEFNKLLRWWQNAKDIFDTAK